MTFKKLAATTAAVLVALSAATYALPRHVAVERSAVLPAAASDVLALAGSNAGFQTFNPYKTMDPALQIDLFGPEHGVGSAFHFAGKDGTGTQTISAIHADEVVYVIDLGAMGQPVQTISAKQTGAGTEVIWRVESDLGFNPIFRVFGLFMDGMMGPTFELGLENLAEAAA